MKKLFHNHIFRLILFIFCLVVELIGLGFSIYLTINNLFYLALILTILAIILSFCFLFFIYKEIYELKLNHRYNKEYHHIKIEGFNINFDQNLNSLGYEKQNIYSSKIKGEIYLKKNESNILIINGDDIGNIYYFKNDVVNYLHSNNLFLKENIIFVTDSKNNYVLHEIFKLNDINSINGLYMFILLDKENKVLKYSYIKDGDSFVFTGNVKDVIEKLNK